MFLCVFIWGNPLINAFFITIESKKQIHLRWMRKSLYDYIVHVIWPKWLYALFGKTIQKPLSLQIMCQSPLILGCYIRDMAHPTFVQI